MAEHDHELLLYLTKCRQLLYIELLSDANADLRAVIFPALALAPQPAVKLREAMHVYHAAVLEVCDWMVYSKTYPHLLIDTYSSFDEFARAVDQAIVDECRGTERVWARSLGTVVEESESMPKSYRITALHTGALHTPPPTPPQLLKLAAPLPPTLSQPSQPIEATPVPVEAPPLKPAVPASPPPKLSTAAPPKQEAEAKPVPMPTIPAHLQMQLFDTSLTKPSPAPLFPSPIGVDITVDPGTPSAHSHSAHSATLFPNADQRRFSAPASPLGFNRIASPKPLGAPTPLTAPKPLSSPRPLTPPPPRSPSPAPLKPVAKRNSIAYLPSGATFSQQSGYTPKPILTNLPQKHVELAPDSPDTPPPSQSPRLRPVSSAPALPHHWWRRRRSSSSE